MTLDCAPAAGGGSGDDGGDDGGDDDGGDGGHDAIVSLNVPLLRTQRNAITT